MTKSLTSTKFVLAVATLFVAGSAFAQTTSSQSNSKDTTTTVTPGPTTPTAATTSEQNAQTTTTKTTTTEEPARSKGGLFLEPMLLGSVDSTEIKTSQLPLIGDDTSGRLETAGLGLRLGGHLGEVVWLAADARYNRSRFMDSSYNNADAAGYNYGATLGAQTPFAGIRVWGSSVLGGEMDPSAGNGGFDVKFKDARGYRVGAGLFIASVAINLEYEDLTYGNTDVQSTGTIIPGGETSVDFSQRGTVLSLSFPVEL